MASVSSHVPFRDLCTVCEKITKKQGKDNKKKVLIDFLKIWREFHSKLHSSESETNDSFYPAMRLLLPQCERAAYGIKEDTLAKFYIEILCLSKDSEDAQKLLNYRSPNNAHGNAGNFANVAFFVLKNRLSDKGTLFLLDINNHLDNIATNFASHDRGEIKKSLRYMLQHTSAFEQKWLIRMILKDMKLGISEQSIFNAYHLDAKDLYNVTNSLEKVCIKLRDPSVRLHEIEISLFNPFRPMLAEQATPDNVEKLMQHQPFYIETKYDGERVQLHKGKNAFKYFSRNANDYTHSYGSTSLEGPLTCQIYPSFKKNVESCILDGEMVVYNTRLDCIVSKGENIDVKYLHEDQENQPCFIVFDILMWNNKVLTNMPLNDRLTYVEKTFIPIPTKIQCATRIEASSKQEAINALNEAIDNREEGIVIKNPFTIYKPNIRKSGGWLKIKPEYVENLMSELDLLIIGGYFGEGRRRGIISHFILGVALSPDKPGDTPQKFYSLTKVGSGYSMKELFELLDKLKLHWKVYDKRTPPPNIEFGSGHKERPDLWIEPSKSQIVQVRATEIVNSDRFMTGCTLRFPRVEKVRYDKPWHQCLSTLELEDLKQQAAGKLASNRLGDGDNDSEDEPSPKKRKALPRAEDVVSVAPQFRPADLTDVKQLSKIFENKEICVVTGTSSHPKQVLEVLIAEYGGTIIQNPGSRTFCVIADKITLRVKNIINTKLYNVVKASWILECVNKNKFRSWTPSNMLHSTEERKQIFSEAYDKFGDSYTSPVDAEDIRKLFSKMNNECWSPYSLTNKELAELEFTYFPNSSPQGLFRLCRAYIDNKTNIENPDSLERHDNLDIAALTLRLYGGTVSSVLDSSVTHAVVYSKELKNLKKLLNIANTEDRGFHVVTEKWIDNCVEKKKWLREQNYQPVKEEY